MLPQSSLSASGVRPISARRVGIAHARFLRRFLPAPPYHLKPGGAYPSVDEDLISAYDMQPLLKQLLGPAAAQPAGVPPHVPSSSHLSRDYVQSLALILPPDIQRDTQPDRRLGDLVRKPWRLPERAQYDSSLCQRAFSGMSLAPKHLDMADAFYVKAKALHGLHIAASAPVKGSDGVKRARSDDTDQGRLSTTRAPQLPNQAPATPGIPVKKRKLDTNGVAVVDKRLANGLKNEHGATISFKRPRQDDALRYTGARSDAAGDTALPRLKLYIGRA